MKLTDFKIGEDFLLNGNLWRCTDIGTRVAVAIEVKEDWMAGPPYALAEVVLDEDDQQVCYRTYDEWYMEDYRNIIAFRRHCAEKLNASNND